MGGLRPWLPAVTVVAGVCVWIVLHPPAPLPPGSDLYDQLGTAKHLIEGDGFLCDVAYPLSYGFAPGTAVPQPLLHRPPGYALLLTIPAAAARGEPAAAVDWTRVLHVLLLAALLAIAVRATLRRGGVLSAAAFTVVLVVNPLLDMTVRWAQVETVVAVLLLAVWVRLTGRSRRAGPGEALLLGLAAGATALLRAELAWLPWLWLAVLRRREGGAWFAVAALGWAACVVPWLARNLVVTGDPFFSVQAFAEHLKDTPGQAGLLPYLGLEGEHWFRTLLRDPALLLTKAGDGMIYQAARLDNWLPWMLAAAAVVGAVVLRLRPSDGESQDVLDGPALAAACWLLMVLLYAPLSHDLRHAAPLAPVALLECWRLTEIGRRRLFGHGPAGALVPLLIAAACVLWGPRMPGWEAAREDAAAERILTAAMVAELGPPDGRALICDRGAVFWYADRRGVITPRDAATLATLRARIQEFGEARMVSGRLPAQDAAE